MDQGQSLREHMGPMEAVNYSFERAADINEVPESTRAMLRMPAAELRVEVPLRRDDGALDVYVGYRIQHNSARGPFKGGIRYHPKRKPAPAPRINPGRRSARRKPSVQGWQSSSLRLSATKDLSFTELDD